MISNHQLPLVIEKGRAKRDRNPRCDYWGFKMPNSESKSSVRIFSQAHLTISAQRSHVLKALALTLQILRFSSSLCCVNTFHPIEDPSSRAQGFGTS